MGGRTHHIQINGNRGKSHLLYNPLFHLERGQPRRLGLVIGRRVLLALGPQPRLEEQGSALRRFGEGMQQQLAQLAGIRVDSQLAVKLPALASGASPVSKGMSINGSLQTNTFNPRQLMATLGMVAPVTKDPKVLQRVSISTAISGNETQVLASNLRIALDGSNITGEAGVRELPNARLYARLNLDQLNADNYLPPSAAPAAAKADAAATKKAVAGLLPVALLAISSCSPAIPGEGSTTVKKTDTSTTVVETFKATAAAGTALPAPELVALAREMRDGVRAAFGVSLRPEPTLVGVEL